MGKGLFVVSSLYREGSNLTMSFCSENQNLILRSSSSVIIVLVTVTWPDVAVEWMSCSLFETFRLHISVQSTVTTGQCLQAATVVTPHVTSFPIRYSLSILQLESI